MVQPASIPSSERALLVVEDDPDHRDAVREALEEEGYRVQTAAHGGDALQLLIEGLRPGVVLLDLRMPVMDGWTFMAELKARPELARIPVIVTSQAGERVLNTAPVAAGYLRKPLDRTRLLQTVARCLSRRQSGPPQDQA